MRLASRRARNQEQAVTVVQSWGVDAIGANQIESILARQGQLLAGFTTPTPAGWGLPGSVPTTDQHVWASPQAFNGAGTRAAFSAWTVGADAPTIYPQDAHATNIVLPGRGGI